MIAVQHAERGRVASLAGELWNLSAFLRRDFLVAWSYRTMFWRRALWGCTSPSALSRE